MTTARRSRLRLMSLIRRSTSSPSWQARVPALELAIWSDLLRNDLVDELYAMVGPKLVGSDKPAFAGVPVTDLHLLGVRQFDDSQSVVLHYAVASRGGRGGC